MIGASDTSPEVERLMAEGYRRMTAPRKMQLVFDACRFARHLHATGHKLRNPSATPESQNREWALMTLGPGPWIDRMEFAAMTQPAEHVRPITHLLSVLDDLNIRYAIGGSLASSVHGYARQTQDADITVEPFPYKERLFAMRFPADEYYADEVMIRDAVARRASFNVLHLPTMFKLDVFVQKDRPFDREAMSRRVKAQVFPGVAAEFGLMTAEDIVLFKLEWYRIGGGISDRQLTDILGVIKTQGDALDAAYLDKWADVLDVADVLAGLRKRV